MTTLVDSTTENFIESIIAKDLAEGRVEKVITRFPPEPNGYLHVGHAKSICLNFGLAERFDGECNLRFDDTNPAKEEQQFIDAIKEDVSWLGFKWAGEVRYASNYFEQFYQWALHLVDNGDAYVCDLTPDEAREYRGWATSPGKESPFRDRSAEENRALLEKMRNGEFDEGHCVLRAKIDMASSNMNLRDPILYRIRKASHHQTGDAWCIYPSYDFAHGQEDAIEGVSHSVCTLEFADHRPLYDWLIERLPVPTVPRQYEFGRLHLNYTITSKRKLKRLVDEGFVAGWDDPRMPTISGMRRKGYSANSIRKFCQSLAVAKTDGIVDVAQLEFFIREDLNETAPRAMCVLNPVKVIISNFDECVAGDELLIDAPLHPNNDDMGSRTLPFTRELYIDRADFTEDTSLSRKKFKRLVLGEFVRLRSAFVIKAESVEYDANGQVDTITASLVPNTVGESPPEGIKPRGVIHWVSASAGIKAEVRLYERLFNDPAPDKADKELTDCLTENSCRTLDDCWIEPSLAQAAPESTFQFEREGYFVADRYDHSENRPVFNLTIGLRASK